jgi:hypothetical protein
MADYERNNGFWETFANSASGALGDYEQLKQQKRQRAIQKLKFIMENSDVGSQVDPQAAEEIQDYAPEGNPYIKDGAFTGTPDQQRVHGFREWAGQNPEADEDQFMTKGMTAGAISPTAYSSFQGRKVAAEQSRQNAIDRAATQKELQQERLLQQQTSQEDRQANQAAMIRLAASLRQGNVDGGDGIFENKANRQAFAAARKMYGNDPYGYITNTMMKDPAAMINEFKKLEGHELIDEAGLQKPEPWEAYRAAHMNPDVREDNIKKYGLRYQEYEALLKHMARMAEGKRTGK